MRGSLVALGIAVVVAAGAVAVPLTVLDGAVSGTPVAADVPVPSATAPPASGSTSEPSCAVGGRLEASGSPLAGNAVNEVAAALGNACPDTFVGYAPVGSGAGIEQFTSGATAMAVVDRPLRDDELAAAGARCAAGAFPFVAHPVTVRYNVAGVESLSLDARTLAKIFSGAITTWNDPAITAQNPDVALSAQPIVVVGRSDESATTAVFQQYLAAAGGWTGGTDTTFTGRATQTARGDGGMLVMIETTVGAIGYLTELAGTRSQVLLLGGVAPDPDAVATAITAALPGAGPMTLDPAEVYRADPGAGAYPLVIVTYAVTCADDPAARDFLLASLSVRGGGGYVFPSGEWADRLAAALQ